MVNNNRLLGRIDTRLSFLNSLLENDIFCISELRMDRRTLVILCELILHDENIKIDWLH